MASLISLSYPQLDLAVVCGTFLLWCLYRFRLRQSRYPLPPGPKPYPIIGNMLDLPKAAGWETYNKWTKKYNSDIISVTSFGKPIIILNSYKAATDLLDHRSNIYSSRPHLTMFHELMGFGNSTAFQPYGPVWRKHRILYHQQMSSTFVQQFQPTQHSAAMRLLKLLLDSPDEFRKHLRYMSARIVMSIAYGHDIAQENDPIIALSENISRAFVSAVRPGAYLVDIFPIFKHIPPWFPGAGFQRYAIETKRGVELARDVPYLKVKSQLKSGIARPSFVGNSLTDLGTEEDSHPDVKNIKAVASGIFGAGTDTTTSTLVAFILAMVLNPDAQEKAQAELDAVVGRGRLPEFSDRLRTPYLEALIKEVFRWFPVAPTGLPHVTTEDDIYEGYRIPAGSTVMANAWSMLNDAEAYPDPSSFYPERFLPGNKFGKIARDPYIGGAFGFGRRICAGRHLAEATIWIAVASILSMFDIKSKDGMDVSYARNPIPGFFSHTQVFKCSITPRSKETEMIVRNLSDD